MRFDYSIDIFKKPTLGFVNPLNCVFFSYFSNFWFYIHYLLCSTFTGFILLFGFFSFKLKQDRIFNISVNNHPQHPRSKTILTSVRIDFAFGLYANETTEYLLSLTSFIQHSVREVCSCRCLLNSDLCVIYLGV